MVSRASHFQNVVAALRVTLDAGDVVESPVEPAPTPRAIPSPRRAAFTPRPANHLSPIKETPQVEEVEEEQMDDDFGPFSNDQVHITRI